MTRALIQIAGDQLLQLHTHFQSQVCPLLARPDERTLQTVAALYIKRQDWNAAMDVAFSMRKTAAAALIISIADSLRRSGASIMLAARGLHLLQKVGLHSKVVAVRRSLCG